MNGIKPGIYRHYKGQYYEVLGLAHHSETLEPLVVYKALYETAFGHGSLWVRPQAMFCSKVFADGREVARFEYTGKQ
ncbi:MAG: DUF1653 domain-containing protein [Candidatus Omnitrophica bacterium]|nr:DUF1653 domain-containing protein [Candidatus Omnitrophota bacterium]